MLDFIHFGIGIFLKLLCWKKIFKMISFLFLKVVQMIKRRESMSNIEKAGLLGLKVSIFNEYGPDSSAFVVDDIREAVSLNPEEAEWHFLLGKVLRRLRKLGTFFEIPEKEEICALENAYSKKKCPAYAIFCATSYKELSTKLFQKFGPENFGEQIKGLNGKALELYRYVYNLYLCSTTIVLNLLV